MRSESATYVACEGDICRLSFVLFLTLPCFCGIRVCRFVQRKSQISLSLFTFYRPHPKHGEGTVFTGVCLSTPGAVPQSQLLSQVWSQVLSGGYPSPRWGVPRTGVFPGQDWDTPSQPGLGYPSPRHNSRASTCYAAGGMPLAFAQEDFLVINKKDSFPLTLWGNTNYARPNLA